jgi:hypothetical protein
VLKTNVCLSVFIAFTLGLTEPCWVSNWCNSFGVGFVFEGAFLQSTEIRLRGEWLSLTWFELFGRDRINDLAQMDLTDLMVSANARCGIWYYLKCSMQSYHQVLFFTCFVF